MASAQVAYQPLGGKARAFFSLATARSERLYLGPDHLLYLRNEQFSESYKRFYFRDIRALVMTESSRREKVNLVWVLLGLVCSAVGWMIGMATDMYVGAWLQVGFGVLFGLCIGVNVALGPTCTCYVKTAVHTHELLSLRRIRTATKVFDLVTPLITAAQGVVTPEELRGHSSGPPAAGVAPPVIGVTGGAVWTPRPTASQPPEAPPRLIRHEDGRYHVLLFLTLLADGALSMVNFFAHGLALTLASVLMTVVMVGLLIAAMIRQQNSDIGKTLRGLVWSTLGYIGVMMALGYVQVVVMSVKNPEVQANQWEWVKFVSRLSPRDSPLLMVGHLASIAGSLVLGILGLFELHRHQRRSAAERPDLKEGVTPARADGSAAKPAAGQETGTEG